MDNLIKIGSYNINKAAVWAYIHHFAKDKEDIFTWERMRKILHDNLFEGVGLDRNSKKGQEFSRQLDKFCEPHIERFDAIAVRAKRLSNADTVDEIKNAAHMLELELYKQQRMSDMGFRGFNDEDKPACRICGVDMNVERARVNDHLATVNGFDKMRNPICIECSENKPDAYHLEFKKIYWGK